MAMLEARVQQMAQEEQRAKSSVTADGAPQPVAVRHLMFCPSSSDFQLTSKSQISFVRSDDAPKRATIQTANPDEIDLGEDEEDEENATGGMMEDEDSDDEGDEEPAGEPHEKRARVAIEKKLVPDEVFGGLAKKVVADDD